MIQYLQIGTHLKKGKNMITPLVGISKIINQYSTIVVGFNGVISDGKNISFDAVKALGQAKLAGKNVILLSNSGLRISQIAKILTDHKVPLSIFSQIMTAGEMVHYMLKNKVKNFNISGKKYYQIGQKYDNAIMRGLDFEQTEDINKADFLFVAGGTPEDTLAKHLPVLSYAVSLNLPMICVGNDISSFDNEQICNAPGAFAEQYATLGGNFITFGKPEVEMLKYALEDFQNVPNSEILMIGDNIQTDIKLAFLYGIDSVLVAKGVHIKFLGEGYIPDVQKAKNLASTYDVYPHYTISELRW